MIYKTYTLPETKVTVTAYLTNNDSVEPGRKRPLVLLCPGGGYLLRVPNEGEPIALRLLSYGIQTVIVNYSVKPAVWPTALNELAEAAAFARSHAEEWYADPDKIAVMGFSAGGHEAASLATLWQTLKWGEQCKPNALILGYAVLTSGEFRHNNSFLRLLGDRYDELLESVSLEKLVTKDCPPTFLWHTWEDELVPVENSLLFAQALRRNGISCEMHLYAHGRHGSGLANRETWKGEDKRLIPANEGWIDLAARWLNEL